MKPSLLISAIALIATATVAQNKNYISNRYSLERMSGVGAGSTAVLPGLPMAGAEVVGDPFSKPNFSQTSALFYNDRVFNGISAKLNLLSDEFYFQTKEGVRVLGGDQIKSFTFTDSLTKKVSTHINGKEFKTSAGIPHKGFFEILYDAEMALLKKTEAYITKANYSVALNVGSKDHKVNKKVIYYYLSGDVVEELPAGKALTSIFGDQKSKVDKYIKINQLNLKDERHLGLVFEYYNQSKTN
jgi:hypothetical protein